MLSLADWQTFLSVEAGAAATLTGLVFVAVSINLAHIMEVPGLPGRAAESILQLLQVFLISSVALIPKQPVSMLAIEILGVALASWTIQIIAQVRYRRARPADPWSWVYPRIIMSQLATAPFCVAGLLLLLDHPEALYWMVPGFVFSFIASVMSAWVLLVEILR